MVADRQNIPLTETFTATNLANYSVYQPYTNATALGQSPVSTTTLPVLSQTSGVYNYAVDTQQHADIRTFVTSGVAENWTVSGAYTSYTLGPQASLNHSPGLSVNLNAGTTTLTSTAKPLDLTAFVQYGDLVLGLPNFPLSSIDTFNSTITLSDGTQSWSVPIGVTALPLINGSCPWWLSLDLVNGIDLSHIVTVQLKLVATAACTFMAAGLRVIEPNWIVSNLDFDTWNGRLYRPLPINGDPTTLSVPANQTLPTLWRSATVPGVDDPRPINGEFGVLFNTGAQTQANSFTLYMREQSQEAFLTQIDLEGDTQAQLTGKPQPSTGVSEYSPLPIGQLDRYPMGSLNAKEMIDLERTSNPVYSSWISFNIQWGPSAQVQVNNSSNATSGAGGYQYALPALSNNTTYLAIFNLTETNARVQIYTLNQSTLALNYPLFDSTVIPDSYAFPRRAGRIGFTATLADGDTYIGAIRPRSLMFAEYRSKPLQSLTPVSGARLYTQSSPDTELFTGWTPLADQSGNQPILSVDQLRYVRQDTDGQSTKVMVNTPSTGSPAQGVISNWLTPPNDPVSGITDFSNLDIDFAVWVPSAAVNSIAGPVLTAALISPNGNSIPLPMPGLVPDQWFNVHIDQPVVAPNPVSGLYQLALYYNATVAASWWLDTVTVHERAIAWAARSVVSDPWHSNSAPWTPFYDTLNSEYDGISFTTMGSQLQMRGQALKQDAVILSSPKLVPQYAELGRLVWPEDAPQLVVPTAAMTVTNTGRAFTFNGLSSSSPNLVGNYYWVFGDGTYGTGPVITHTYPSYVASGTQYTAALTVIDRSGFTASSAPQQITLP